ncbi:HEPN domain-containing protein [uncultured Tolumonas sp.]|uniref:HEPN domain-containing protein n=1 Tax=uncultured Tolumonas sp. TaxID=263765 RepID=UPI002931A00C|nr:HEPN domain-containing protein [uncultured Tolumonas sp.]
MDKKTIASLTDSLKNIVSKSTPLSSSNFGNLRMHDGVAYGLSTEAAVEFNELISKILKHKNFSSKFSSGYIEVEVKKILAKYLKNPKIQLNEEFYELIRFLEKDIDSKTIHMRIEGLKTNVEFEIGNVKFINGNNNAIAQLKNKMNSVLALTKNSEQEKESISNQITNEFNDELLDFTIAIVKVNAEPERAFELAKEEIQRSIDILRYASKFLYPINEDIRIGLKGERPTSSRLGFILSDDSFNTKNDNLGSRRYFDVTEIELKRMNEIGIPYFSEMLKKKQTTNYEESLIQAVHWLSISLIQDETGNSFLFLIAALESLFKQKSGNSITGTVSECVALMLANTLESRKSLVKLMRDYYGKRSAVAHGGKKTISDNDLNTLTYIVLSTISFCVKNIPKFRNQDMFMDWFDDLKFSAVLTKN